MRAVCLCVQDGLSTLNAAVVLQTAVVFLEAAVPDPRLKGERAVRASSLPDILALFDRFWEWLDGWWAGQQAKGPTATSDPAIVAFKHDSWVMLTAVLCKLSANFSPQVCQQPAPVCCLSSSFSLQMHPLLRWAL